MKVHLNLHGHDSPELTLLNSVGDGEGYLIFRKNTDRPSIPRRGVARVGRGGGDVAAEEWRCLPLGFQATGVCYTVPQEHSYCPGDRTEAAVQVVRFGLYEMTSDIASVASF